METFRKIVVLNNEVEALTLESMLKEREIPHRMRSYRDAAYDGLFQMGYGWGHVEAPEKHADAILEMAGNFRNDTRVESENYRPKNSSPAIAVVAAALLFFMILGPIFALSSAAGAASLAVLLIALLFVYDTWRRKVQTARGDIAS